MPEPTELPGLSDREVERVRLELLRRRVWWYRWILGFLLIAGAAFAYIVAVYWQHATVKRPQLIGLLMTCFMGVVVVAAPFIRERLRPSPLSLKQLIRRVSIAIILALLGQATGAELLAGALTKVCRELGVIGPYAKLGLALPLTGFLFITHTAASFVVPWTVREAARPVLILAIVHILVSFGLSNDPVRMKFFGLGLLLLAGLPGTLIAYLRTGRFRELVGTAALRSNYSEVQRELATARRIHERLFPEPRAYGRLRLAYRYEPTRQIGGDYIDLTTGPDGSAMIVVVDVTGHGIPAALAVNRIHGEIKRVLRENTAASPRDVIAALGNYIHLTLADETVFATVLAMRLNPDAGTLHYCNAGHPPAFLLQPDGALHTLDSTAMMLGPLSGQELEPEEATLPLAPGDILFAYTDGAFESTDTAGAQLGIDGLRRSLLTAAGNNRDPDHLVSAIDHTVRTHRDGPAQDDTLLLAIEILKP